MTGPIVITDETAAVRSIGTIVPVVPYRDTVTSLGIDLRPEPMMVMRRCAHTRLTFHCDTCRKTIANAGNVVLHCEQHPGEHRLAAWCGEHHLYMPPTAEEVATITADLDRLRATTELPL